jgi:MFS family permease
MLGYGVWRGAGRAATPDEMDAMRWVFAISLLPGLAAMAALIGKVREIAPRGAPGPSPGATTGQNEGLAGWRALPGRFYAFVAIVTLFALGNSSDLFLLLYGKTRFNLSLASVMGLWVLLHLSKIAFSVPGGALSDRLGRRPIIVLGWAVYALVYLGMSSVAEQWQFWALLLAYGIYYGMTEGTEKALVADFVPSGLRGTAYGVYHGAVGLAALPASLLFGVFWAVIGPRIAFGIGAGLAGLAAVLLIVLLSAARRPAAL